MQLSSPNDTETGVQVLNENPTVTNDKGGESEYTNNIIIIVIWCQLPVMKLFGMIVKCLSNQRSKLYRVWQKVEARAKRSDPEMNIFLIQKYIIKSKASTLESEHKNLYSSKYIASATFSLVIH